MQHVRVTSGLTDWNVQSVQLQEYLDFQQKQWGSTTYNDCEYLTGNTLGKPVFDFDNKMSQQPTPLQIATANDTCLQAINGMFAADPKFSLDRVITAYRHGPLTPGSPYTHKLSFRFWVLGYKILLQDMKLLIAQCAAPEYQDLFDLSIYSARRLLAVVGGCKGNGDYRILDMDDRSQAVHCMTQHLEGDETLLDLAEAQTAVSTLTGTPPDNWDVLAAALTRAGFINPCYVSTREHSVNFRAGNLGGECVCCGLEHDNQCWFAMQAGMYFKVKSYSSRCRTMTIRATPDEMCEEIVLPSSLPPVCQHLRDMGFSNNPIDGMMDDMTQCKIVRQHLQTCPICKISHISDKWYLESLVSECFTLRNSETACKARLMWFCGPEQRATITNSHLQDIFLNPTSHSPYVELYLEEHKGNIISDDAGNLYEFNGVRWQHKMAQQVANSMQDWFKQLFDKFFDLFAHEDSITKNAKQLDDIRKQTRRAHGHVLNEATIKQVMSTIKRKVHLENFNDKMDMQPMLIGFENGTFQLDTGVFREGRREDMISKSTGYDYQPRGGEDMLSVESFMEAIYPVEEERSIASLYYGYCLLGDAPEKKMAFLTDGGGKRTGYNGKTTVVKALHAALGDDYSIKGKEAFLYRNDSSSETANSHNAGDLVYKGKRVAYYEELSAVRHLADAKLKDLTGSCTTIQARGCHETKATSFEWTAKLLLCFNMANLPDLDYTDKSLLDRILVLHHRSKFCDNDKEYEEQQHIPYTFPADPDMKDKIQRWRPQLFHYFYQGLEKYFEVGFRQIPASCEEWKQKLMQTKDTVAQFVEDNLEKTGDKSDAVDTNSMYEMYKGIFTQEKNKKTALGKRKWFEQLWKVMTDDGYAEDPRLMPDGSRKRRTWLGWKIKV